GYDGPTGLGTPNGLGAFRSGPHGTVAGTVTSSGSGAAIAGATISVGSDTATSAADGSYTMSVPPGDYRATAAAYGYQSSTASVTVADGGSVTADFTLDPIATHTVTGKVTDGSGHDWPLYAKITVDGVPGGPVYTNPYTGKYSLSLPTGKDYTVHATAQLPGYTGTDAAVSVRDTDVHKNLTLLVDQQACTAPGYTQTKDGLTETFDATTIPDGWTDVDATGRGNWVFDNPVHRGNGTGGSGNFAILEATGPVTSQKWDASLLTPMVDMSDQANPWLAFDTNFSGGLTQVADVDLSIDGGANWSTVWHRTAATKGHQEIQLTTAAYQASVQVRFRYTALAGFYWEVDDVFLGNLDCTPKPGGLVAGRVLDANTGSGVESASVTSGDAPTETATTTDSAAGTGFYWMFSSLTGSHPFTAAKARYHDATAAVAVRPDDVTHANITLTAGRISLSKQSIRKALDLDGGTATGSVTVTNTGGQPASVSLAEHSGGFQIQATQTGAPRKVVKADVSPLRHRGTATGAAPDTGASGDAWTPIANLPLAVQDNAAGEYHGKVYSAFGFTGTGETNHLYVYDPVAGSWTQGASAADARDGTPAHGFIGGKFYAVGGWTASGSTDTKLEIYDPASNTWSTGATAPKAYAGAGSAVLGGKLYSVGGCTSTCGVKTVLVYDAATDSWSQAADYPVATAWQSCGAIAGKLYCAGGSGAGTSGYVYDPATDGWSPIADLPADLWGSAYTAANGLLLVSGGVTNGSAALTNQGFAYDPQTNSWTALPNANAAIYRGGSALGFYQIGGNPGGANTAPTGSSSVLSGYDQGSGEDVSWLSLSAGKFLLAPGASKRVKVTVDASDPAVTQPGKYAAEFSVATDTPYLVTPVAVTMKVAPPSTWGKITGTVSADDGSGAVTPLAGAQVEIDGWAAGYLLTTDGDGHFALWLDYRNSPVTVIVAKPGYHPQVKSVTIRQGKTVRLDVTLKKA
ncbi:carboxypeptidase regulatory-like domain-containing protein, partial [Actinocatenispora thailandica]